MNLSPELMAHIGSLLRIAGGGNCPCHDCRVARELRLEWVKSIESALRETEQRERDMETMPSYRRIQAG